MLNINVVDLEKWNNFHVGHFFYLSSILKVIAGLQIGPWSFWKFRLGPFPLPPAPLLSLAADRRRHAARPPLWAALPRHLPPASFHASRPSSSTPSSFALDLPSLRHAPPKLRAAATSPPPWPGQDRARRSFLSRASASLEVPQRVPLALSHAPCPVSPNQRRRSSVTPASSTPQRSRHCSSPPPALTP